MRIIVSAGGTGGHIYPALAIINKIKDMEPSSRVLYVGTTDRMESRLIPSLGIPYESLEIKGLNRHSLLKNFEVLKLYNKAYKKSLKIIKDFKPDVVLGVGGYVTAPLLKAAVKLHIKTAIHEQNSIAGITNKMLGRKVDKIFISMKDSINDFPKEKVVFTGNPRSQEIINEKPVTKKELGFDNKPLILIVMGSLGSATINSEELEITRQIKNKDYNILLVTGERYFGDYKDIDLSSNIKVVPFEKRLSGIMKSTDLIVTRAGASTISEITAIGLPSILVPSPYVTNNHQYKNALELEKNGAGIILPEKDFKSSTLLPLIDNLLSDKERLESMHKNALKLGITDSSDRIYKELKKLIGD